MLQANIISVFVIASFTLATEKRGYWDREIFTIARVRNFIRFDEKGQTKGNFNGGPFRTKTDYHDR